MRTIQVTLDKDSGAVFFILFAPEICVLDMHIFQNYYVRIGGVL